MEHMHKFNHVINRMNASNIAKEKNMTAILPIESLLYNIEIAGMCQPSMPRASSLTLLTTSRDTHIQTDHNSMYAALETRNLCVFRKF